MWIKYLLKLIFVYNQCLIFDFELQKINMNIKIFDKSKHQIKLIDFVHKYCKIYWIQKTFSILSLFAIVFNNIMFNNIMYNFFVYIGEKLTKILIFFIDKYFKIEKSKNWFINKKVLFWINIILTKKYYILTKIYTKNTSIRVFNFQFSLIDIIIYFDVDTMLYFEVNKNQFFTLMNNVCVKMHHINYCIIFVINKFKQYLKKTKILFACF